MNITSAVGVRPADPQYAQASSGRVAPGYPAHQAPAVPRRPTLLRRVTIATLSPNGDVEEATRLVPSLPVFEEAFAAFARGTLLPTAQGYVAVEDLWPGMEVRTASGKLERLLWRGSTMVVPRGEGQDPAMMRLTRIPADSFGYGRPYQDLVLGPRARIVDRRSVVRVLTRREAALIPASDVTDGIGIVDVTPATSVEVFHLGFERHEIILANGVEVESYHPGPLSAFPLRDEHLSLFLGCFPHCMDLRDFGEPELPRLRLKDLDIFDAV